MPRNAFALTVVALCLAFGIGLVSNPTNPPAARADETVRQTAEVSSKVLYGSASLLDGWTYNNDVFGDHQINDVLDAYGAKQSNTGIADIKISLINMSGKKSVIWVQCRGKSFYINTGDQGYRAVTYRVIMALSEIHLAEIRAKLTQQFG